MGRVQGLTDTVALNNSQLLKQVSSPDIIDVFSMTVAWSGATAGDLVYLRDGTDGTATPKVVIALDAAAGTYQLNWANGKRFTTGLYYDEGAAGNVHTEITYK